MNDFEKLMENEGTQELDQRSLELPDEIKEEKEASDSVDDQSDVPSETPSVEELFKDNDIQYARTRVNISGWCGCNNACFHSCFNIG